MDRTFLHSVCLWKLCELIRSRLDSTCNGNSLESSYALYKVLVVADLLTYAFMKKCVLYGFEERTMKNERKLFSHVPTICQA